VGAVEVDLPGLRHLDRGAQHVPAGKPHTAHCSVIDRSIEMGCCCSSRARTISEPINRVDREINGAMVAITFLGQSHLCLDSEGTNRRVAFSILVRLMIRSSSEQA
jgi:hypothetical protein